MAVQKGVDRWIAALLVCTGGAAAILWSHRAATPSEPRLVATAHQFGPVGYRDPAGAVSPDGRWLAYSEGRFLRIMSLDEGAVVALPAGDTPILHLSWDPSSRLVLTDGFRGVRWGVWDRESAARRPLWLSADATAVTDATWSPDGRIAAIANTSDGQELRVATTDGRTLRATPIAGRASSPAWLSNETVACIVAADGRSRITIPCGGKRLATEPDGDVYGPLAFSPDRRTAYAGLVNASGIAELWALPTHGGPGTRLAPDSFGTAGVRDTYGASLAADGRIVFKAQRYETYVAVAPAAGGPTERVTAFQSETPSWDPTGEWIGLTYGTWRRLADDAKYPDIAQDVGVVRFRPGAPAATSVARTIHNSLSEDQSLCWSPNGKWIAFHSHQDGSDDIWLRPARDDTAPVRLSFLGRGAETGWPRWSPDGKWLLFAGARRAARGAVGYVLRIDQDSGALVAPARELPVRGVEGEFSHGEWIGSDTIVALNEDAAGIDLIYTVGREGGDARIVRRFASEHHAPGLAASPDGRDVAFIAPAADGRFQVFRMPIAGGAPVQVTNDPTNKTQPAWSPDGRRLAFTVWGYDMSFWMTGGPRRRSRS